MLKCTKQSVSFLGHPVEGLKRSPLNRKSIGLQVLDSQYNTVYTISK